MYQMKTGFMKFLAPPNSHCYQCGNQLTLLNDPVSITWYSFTGPLPGTKLSLRCRKCPLNYNYSMYGNTSIGYRYYDAMREGVKASDAVYIDRRLCTFFATLGYVKIT